MVKYQAPSLEKEKYIEWYKEGFESNIDVKEIQEAALSLGKSGEPYKLSINIKSQKRYLNCLNKPSVLF